MFGATPECTFLRFLLYVAGDKGEVPDTSSRDALGRAPPTELKANTGAAQAVRELKAEHRRKGMPTQDKHLVPDKV